MTAHKLLPALLLCLSLPLQAQVYTWVDENGRKHFGSQPPTPEQRVETVTVRHGYSSDGQQPAAMASGQQHSADSAPTAGAPQASPRQMCSEAMRWTAIDIPNLREIAAERKQAGKITGEQHKQTLQGLTEAEKYLTLQNCMASKGKDRERFECLSRGGGIMICSGALDAALKNR